MSATDRQFQFVDGQFVDTWNPGRTDATEPAVVCYDPDDGLPWWAAILDVCGCAAHEHIGAALAAYLSSERRTATSWLIELGAGLDDELLALMADRLGLTEHGSTIRFAWVTDAGRRWLHLWERAHASNATPA